VKIIAVIPARYDSSRFAGKVLARDTGKYLVEHTYEAALRASSVDRVFVATDSEAVMRACGEFGADCVMTSCSHKSGTDRIAEAVRDIEADIVVNVQADEPEVAAECIDQAVGLLVEDKEAVMGTLTASFDNSDQIVNPNVVKCVVDKEGRAIYFSRSVIPYCRDGDGLGDICNYLRHVGVYSYRKDFLLEITGMARSSLEISESLEQLRAIEYGYKIVTGRVDHTWEGIDTSEQYASFVERYKEREV
jgi:3-deoxy-manno-octulosonate cytidylyltransferase (CMP-KDO synthetase)